MQNAMVPRTQHASHNAVTRQAWSPLRSEVTANPSSSAVLLLSLPLRLVRRPRQRVHLQQLHGQPLPIEPALGSPPFRPPSWTVPILDRGSGRLRIGQHPRSPPRRGRLFESDEKLSDERLGVPSNLFLQNRHHPRVRGGGPAEPAATLRGYRPHVQRRRPCTRRGWPRRGARPLPRE